MQEHILKQFDRDLSTLKDRILLMAGLVEAHVAEAMTALSQQDRASAERLARSDRPVNLLEMECDELCTRMIAQWQPTASDLRFVVAALKITTDLERIGDLATHIAERAVELAAEPPFVSSVDLPAMAALASSMVHRSLDAFVREDVDLALEVLSSDDEIDKLHAELFRNLLTIMGQDPRSISRTMRQLFISKYLERIGDHATNIAEMVIFMVKGRSIRHLDTVPREL